MNNEFDPNDLTRLQEILEDTSTLPFNFDLPLKVDISMSHLKYEPRFEKRIVDENHEVVYPVREDRFYRKDGLIGVLFHRSYGVGLSSECSNADLKEFLLFSPSLICAHLNKKDVVEALYITSAAGFNPARCNLEICWDGMSVEWLKPGQKFFVDEYDGSERIVTYDDIKWMEV